MYKILTKKKLRDGTTMMEIEAPHVAKKALAGQFIIFRVDKLGERVPLTIAGTSKTGVTIVFDAAGASTSILSTLEAGEYIQDFVGPLGKPTHINEKAKRVCVIGGGVGSAAVLPIAKAYFEPRNTQVDIIASFKGAEFIILENEMKNVCNNLYMMTDDGSYGEQGFVTGKLTQLIESGVAYDEVITIGAPIMMKFVAQTTKPYGIKTVASLNPIMIDGTGMCGCCRVSVGGKMRFACVEGPEFDAHEIDFDSLMIRNSYYVDEEQKSRENCRLVIKGRDA